MILGCGSRRQAGFTFNELLVAMNLMVVAVLGYSLSSVDVFRRQAVSDYTTTAIHLAQDKIEELQSRKIQTDVDLCPSGGEHGISAGGGGPAIFDRCWRIAPSPLGSKLKQIDVTVSWRALNSHQFALSTLLYVGD